MIGEMTGDHSDDRKVDRHKVDRHVWSLPELLKDGKLFVYEAFVMWGSRPFRIGN